MSLPRRAILLLGTLLLLGLVLAPGVGAEDEAPAPRPQLGDRESEGLGREGMWPAPTAEDWAKPCLIEWQRTWDDAVAVAKETGKPILVCINMDGEIASEHWAGKRYRQPEVAELYDQYVTVIASVYRHNPRDYDDEGHRIPCPRFGGVTCGEHIAIEPVIYEKFCDGKRIAPRHIAVDLDDNEAYDVYYVDDTAGVFDSIIDGRGKFPPAGPPIVRGDRPLIERVASRHALDRRAVEDAYQNGDADARRALLESALKHGDAAQLDLLRLAVFGLDVNLSKRAREALTKIEAPSATTLISEALRVPMDASERDALIATLKRLGEESTLARWLAGVHEGLAARSTKLDAEAWAQATTDATEKAAKDADSLIAQAEYQAKAAEAHPDDPAPRLDLADASLTLALDAGEHYPGNPRMARLVARHLYQDARDAALEAVRLGATGWRPNHMLALAAYYAGDTEEAYARAEKAMDDMPPGDGSWRSMALVTIFAESRWKGIKKAVKAKEPWPKEWLADLHAAYGVLLRHPLGTDAQVAWHHGFLMWLGAEHRADRLLHQAIRRFPASDVLHERFRERVLRFRGPVGLEARYAKLLAENPDEQALVWYAALAHVKAAETLRRTQKPTEALAAYERALTAFGTTLQAFPDLEEGVNHAAALALAGRARVFLLLEDEGQALDAILASFARSPDSAGSRDGMGVTPGETAQMLLHRLRKAEDVKGAALLEAALSALDPELLRPDRGLLGDTPGR